MIDIGVYKAAAKAGTFYDVPYWYCKKDPKPVYYDLFVWQEGHLPYNPNPDSVYLYGTLMEGLFDSLDKKIAYLQGVIEDYSGLDVRQGGDSICFANSAKKVERCKNWINEVAYYNSLGDGVVSHLIKYCIPICHTVKIQPKVLEFIQNYKFQE